MKTNSFEHKPPKTFPYFILLFVFACCSVSEAKPFLKDVATPQYEPGEFIVKFKQEAGQFADAKLSVKTLQLSPSHTGLASIDVLNARYKVRKISPVFDKLKSKQIKSGKSARELYQEVKDKFPMRSRRAPKNFEPPNLLNIYKIELEDKTADILAICEEYKKDRNVEYAEPNYIPVLLILPTESNGEGGGGDVIYGYPDDPYFWSRGSWGQDFDDQWGLKKIQAREAWEILEGSGSSSVIIAISDSGIDGRHPDLQSNLPLGNSYTDSDGHGTWVAGIAGAVTNNRLGVAGVSGNSSIVSVLNGYHGVQQAAEEGADVISCSWLGQGLYLHDAVRYAYGLGVIIVVATGNDHRSLVQEFASWPEVIAVGASERDDSRCGFSNYGLELDVVAPGRDILSTLAKDSFFESSRPSQIIGEGDYRYFYTSGTSGATPFVSGMVALVLSRHPEFTFQQVRSALTVSADDVGSVGFDIETGFGRINAKRAVQVNEVPIMEITFPIVGATINPQAGFLNIVGTASGPGFQNYTLSYGQGLNPASWIEINHEPINTPVDNGILGTWVISDLVEGIYMLKLTLVSTSGFQFQDVIHVEISLVRQITTNPWFEIKPAISGNNIIWLSSRNYNNDIYLFDLSTNIERQITTNPDVQTNPAISGDIIVWEDYRNTTSEDCRDYNCNTDIYLFDLSTNTERQITTNSSPQDYPSISGNRVVWQDRRNNNPDIYLFYLSTNTERQITTNPAGQSKPVISGDLIAWQDYRNGNSDIYLFDLSTNTERQITNDPEDQYSPVISGDLIIWEDRRNGNSDIYLFDLSTNTERQITNDPADQYSPAISGNQIVWVDYRNENYDIYGYDLATNTEKQITSHLTTQWAVAISGDIIVWEDYRNRDADIYLYDLDESSPTYVSGNVANQIWDINGSPYIVVGDLEVPQGTTLAMNPGIEIRFDGNYSLVVHGTLSAIGEPNNRILFTSNKANPQPADWSGINFGQNSANSVIKDSTIEYADMGIIEDYAHSAHTQINHNIIRFNNKGIYLNTGGNPDIINNDILNNGYGIYASNGPAIVKNNIIVQNSIYGIYRVSGIGGPPVISYNDVWQNATNYGDISAGTGDISQDPRFVNPTNGDYHLQGYSPCINKGDPSSPNDPDNTRADIGAFYYYLRLNPCGKRPCAEQGAGDYSN